MPAEKKRNNSTPQTVPELGDPDRKRVLNVLAQRRYRQRRREKIAALEAQAKILAPLEACQPQDEGGIQLDSVDQTTSSSDTSPNGSSGVEELIRDPSSIGLPSMELDQSSVDWQLFPDFNFSTLPSPIPTSPSSPKSPSQPLNILPQSGLAPMNFPLAADGALISIPVLSALRAFGTIATTLNIMTEVYNPFYLHTLPPTPQPSLPPNLHPTPAQIAIPHHPLLDTLPWPSVREKLICMFALPSTLRAPIARGENWEVIMKIVHDVDDFKDGCRVHGNLAGWGEGSELVEEAWEIGEKFYRNWWWCLDGKVMEITNRRRRERGLGALRIKG
ncbi:hypothetical protein CC78DRAFT_534564 [Lojkania enalia]|uniref:BZIP domain-containing protein n=1 Tax=Lojkania enalia TaxID=147567 RepID=A0A9P4K9V4_9PLEO|nr:hypothetical protein CC78DRAFT_534564 [Didymosphaeria enalia]